MSPQPEVSVNVQRYIGTSLISHQARGKKNICHSTPGRILHKEGQQNARGVCLDYQRPVCNCFSSNSDFSKHSHSKLNSCIWTGVPLINLSSRQIKNSVKPMYEIIGSRDLENGFIRAHELEESIFSMSPLRSNGYSYLNVNDILPMSKLAIHTRGSPLIISAERKDRTKPFSENLNISDGTLAEGKDFIPARRFQRPGDFCWTEDSHKRYVVSSSLLSSGTPIEHLQSGDETTSVSGESDVKSEPDYVRQSQQSDCISVTSEESSGTSEAFVPRIIKPRKRRRRDKKTAMIQNSLCSGSGILTLIPYQPLCYKYYERPKAHTRETHKKELCDSDTKESQSQFSDFHDSRMNLKLQDCSLLSSRSTHSRQDRYPYPPSPFCRCIYCVNSSSLMVSTIPKFDSSKPLIRKETVSSSTESMCEITARIVTSPCGSRDLEIKFIPIASSSYGDNESTAVECETFSTSSSEPSSPSCTSPLTQLHPPQRPWIPLALPDRQKPTCIFTVMCYNILCPKYATRQLYGYCPSWALSWEYRRKGIMEEIRHYSADIISLQEVETDQFYNFFLPELKNEGYDGIFSPKSRAKIVLESERKHVDGCAIFFRSDKFSLIKDHLVEFNQLAMANAEGSDDMLNRVQTKDNIGLTALLQTREGAFENGAADASQIHQPLLVCTAHLHWDPEFSDVKIIQTMMLMNELQSIVEEASQSFYPGCQRSDANNIPLLLCGDFNSLPGSGVVEFLSLGRVSVDHVDFKKLGYKDCLRKLSSTDKTNEYTHDFKLSRAYKDDIMSYTNYTYDFKGIIDYIFYSKKHITVLGLLGSLDQEWIKENKIAGCPHPHIPSDHFPLLVELEMTLPTSSPMLLNGLMLNR